MSDLKKMMKSWRESWSKDSKVASQAVILMFIPTILELWLNKRDACVWRRKYRQRKLSGSTLKQMRVMGKARQASLHLHFSLTHLLFRLYSWAPGMNTSRRVKLSSREGPKWFLFSPAPEVIRLPNLAVFAVTGYGQEGDAKPNLETVMKKSREGKLIISHLSQCPRSWEEH